MKKKECKVVGVLNVTPDSFSDGGKHFSTKSATVFAKQLCAEGCDIIDVGGQSTRPGYTEISAEEEIGRVGPVLKSLKEMELPVPLSIDTYYPKVAEISCSYGVNIINYTLSFDDPSMLRLAKERNAYIIFNFCGSLNLYKDFCESRKKLVKEYKIDEEKVIFDPGVGFGKTFSEDLELIMQPEKFMVDGYPLYLGLSRKRVVRVIRELLLKKNMDFSENLKAVVNKHENYLDAGAFELSDLENNVEKIKNVANFFSKRIQKKDLENCDDRDFLTGILSLIAVKNGVDFIRVHNVKLMSEVLNLANDVVRVPSLSCSV